MLSSLTRITPAKIAIGALVTTNLITLYFWNRVRNQRNESQKQLKELKETAIQKIQNPAKKLAKVIFKLIKSELRSKVDENGSTTYSRWIAEMGSSFSPQESKWAAIIHAAFKRHQEDPLAQKFLPLVTQFIVLATTWTAVHQKLNPLQLR